MYLPKIILSFKVVVINAFKMPISLPVPSSCVVFVGVLLFGLALQQHVPLAAAVGVDVAVDLNVRRVVEVKNSGVDTKERGHEKDPDLLLVNGDNPGWTDPPTPRPTALPTTSPTGNPTSDPTASPTKNPTSDPTASPTIKISCHYDDDASIFAGEQLPATRDMSVLHIQVPFVYDIETTSEWSSDEMNSQILPKVERALAQEMLPTVFLECQEVGKRNRARLHASEGRETRRRRMQVLQETVAGFSTEPADVAVDKPGVSCGSSQTDDNKDCAVVEGRMTLYVLPEYAEKASYIIMQAQRAVRSIMESGTLNNGVIEVTVQRVTYVKHGPFKAPLEVTKLESSGESSESARSNGFPYYIAASAGAVSIGAMLLIIGAKIRSRRRRGDGGDEDSDGSDINSVEDHNVTASDSVTMAENEPYISTQQLQDESPAMTYDLDSAIGSGDWAAAGVTGALLASVDICDDDGKNQAKGGFIDV